MWEYLRWHTIDRDPRPNNIYSTEVEVTLSKAPYAQTLTDMDVHNFDFSASNYRLEAIVAFSLFGTFLMATICIIVCKGRMFKFELSEEQEKQFTELQAADEGYKNLVVRRTQLEQMKKSNQRREERKILERQITMKMMQEELRLLRKQNKKMAHHNQQFNQKGANDTSMNSVGHRISHLEGQTGVDGRGAHQPLNRSSTIDNSWISDKSLPTYDNVMGSFDTNQTSMETSPDKRGNPWARALVNSSGADESFGPSVDGSLIMNKSDFMDKSASVDAGPFGAGRGK